MQQRGEEAVLAGASWKGSFLDLMAAQYNTGKIVSSLIGSDTLFIRM